MFFSQLVFASLLSQFKDNLVFVKIKKITRVCDASGGTRIFLAMRTVPFGIQICPFIMFIKAFLYPLYVGGMHVFR